MVRCLVGFVVVSVLAPEDEGTNVGEDGGGAKRRHSMVRISESVISSALGIKQHMSSTASGISSTFLTELMRRAKSTSICSVRSLGTGTISITTSFALKFRHRKLVMSCFDGM